MHSEKTRIFTRAELHELVWSKPLSELGPILGISDRGLGKICARHLVPSPPRGYWAKLEAGQPVKITPLRKVANGALDQIYITSSGSPLSDAARAKFQEEASARIASLEKATLLLAGEQPSSSPLPSNFIEGPIEKPHKSIVSTAKALRKAKPDETGAVRATNTDQCGIVIHSSQIERTIAVLHNLATKLEERKLHLIPAGATMRLRIGSDEISFTLTERHRREKHVPTPDELALFEKRELARKREAARRGWYENWERQEPWDEYDRVYTGQLVLAVNCYADGLRKTWGDGTIQKLEKMLDPAILDGLELLLAFEKESREKREKDQRERQDLARRHQLLKLRREREEKRLSYLQKLMDAGQEASYIRNWLAMVTDVEENSEFGRMLSWARIRLRKLEDLTNPDVVDKNLQKDKLFPEQDELEDPLGDPPEGYSYW